MQYPLNYTNEPGYCSLLFDMKADGELLNLFQNTFYSYIYFSPDFIYYSVLLTIKVVSILRHF